MGKTREITHHLVWSNGGYIIVAILGFFRLGRWALASGVLAVASLLYHLSGEKKFETFDDMAAGMTIVINTVLFFHHYESHWTQIGAIIALASLLIFYKQHANYEKYHAIWHGVTAFATLLIFYGSR